MASLIASLGANLACCFGRTALNCCFNACGSRTSTASRVGYALMFTLTSILSWVMMSDWAERKLAEISFGYLKLNCPQGSCYGVLSVYRICFANTIFHAILSGFMYGVSSSRDWRSGVQNGYWAFKFMGWIAFIVAAFFIPNTFFAGWGRYIDVPGAVLFILVQIVLLIDFAYSFSETLLEWWESSEDKKYLALLLTVTFGAFAGVIVLTGFLYAWFAGNSCQLNTFFITFNLILCFLAVVLSIAPAVQEVNPKSGLAQAAMVTVYATYLVASALSSEPQPDDGSAPVCNPLSESDSTKNMALIMGSILTFVALAYSTSRAAVLSRSMMSDEGGVPLMSDHVRGAVESGALPSSALDDEDGAEGPVDDEKEGVQYSYSFFHLIFLLASCYLATLITNWDTVTIEPGKNTAVVGRGWAAVWVKIVSGWVVILLYAWTLVAPIVLPDREFY
ncbi:serine incorporator/TMS membrane protein [Zopfochytrium polystomum]|nr:serine incorporator/TMS membrane protein [Zopfochytrium polystomum]